MVCLKVCLLVQQQVQSGVKCWAWSKPGVVACMDNEACVDSLCVVEVVGCSVVVAT